MMHEHDAAEQANPGKEPSLPSHPEDPASPREIENPGDPGPPVLVPPEPPVLPGRGDLPSS